MLTNTKTVRLVTLVALLVTLGRPLAPAFGQSMPAGQSAPAVTPIPAAAPVAVRHVPVASAPAEQELQIPVEVEGAERVGEITLHYRVAGTSAWIAAPFHRVGTVGFRFVAVVPAGAMLPGTLDYYIDSRPLTAPAGTAVPHFANAADPHPLIVVGDEEARWQRELYAGHLYQRSRLQLRFEWTDLGSRALGSGSVPDNFWRLEGDYTYRILGWIYSIRLGAGLVRGNTWFVDSNGQLVALPDGKLCDIEGNSPHHYCAIGLTYGFAEMRFRFGRYVRVDLKAIFGAGPEHFDGGAAAQVVLGNALGSHFDLGFEAVSTLGTRAWTRLAWDTVPYVPMSFTVEVLNLPDNGNVAGRVFLTLNYRPTRKLVLELLAGYGTRGWRVGGPVLGGGASVEF